MTRREGMWGQSSQHCEVKTCVLSVQKMRMTSESKLEAKNSKVIVDEKQKGVGV